MKVYLDINTGRFDYYSDLEDVTNFLHSKQEAINRRQAYGKLIAANKEGNEDDVVDAHIAYMKQRKFLSPQKPEFRNPRKKV